MWPFLGWSLRVMKIFCTAVIDLLKLTYNRKTEEKILNYSHNNKKCLESLPLDMKIQQMLDFAEELTSQTKWRILHFTLSPVVHDKFICQAAFANKTTPLPPSPFFCCTEPRGTTWKGVCFQSNLTLASEQPSATVGKNERVKLYRSASGTSGGSHDAKNSQTCPADDLVHWSCCAGLTQAGYQWQEGSGRRVSTSGGLRRAGQWGRALLQGSPWPGFACGNYAGAWSVTRPLFWLAVWEGESAISDWCISTCCQLAVCSAKQGVKTRDKNMACLFFCVCCVVY